MLILTTSKLDSGAGSFIFGINYYSYPLNLYNTILQLVTLIIISNCAAVQTETSCTHTANNFVSYFNGQQDRKIHSLFQPKILGSQEVKRMSNNLNYIYGVAGKIRSLQFSGQEANKISYRSMHENAAMDITFRVNDRCQLMSYQIKTHYPDSLPKLGRNITSISLPFQDEWYVEWGGFTIDQNYHNAHRNMKGAFDFSRRDQSGKSFQNQGKKNEDYYAFDQPVTAPCRATVIKVIDGVEDNKVGRTNAMQTYGNLVVLRTDKDEYLLLAHLKKGSVGVEEGQQVDQGAVLAHCGNSGYSTQPHLHFIVQNVADLFHPTGAYCYFDNIMVNGELKQDYSPVQGEQVSNQAP
jgi:murein DD-endopeptidase MepM/ murein hydrolase activator NlpD